MWGLIELVLLNFGKVTSLFELEKYLSVYILFKLSFYEDIQWNSNLEFRAIPKTILVGCKITRIRTFKEVPTHLLSLRLQWVKHSCSHQQVCECTHDQRKGANILPLHLQHALSSHWWTVMYNTGLVTELFFQPVIIKMLNYQAI